MTELEASTDGIVMQKLQPFPHICFTASQNMMTNTLNLLGFVLVVCWFFLIVFLLLLLLSFAIILFAHSEFCPSLQQKHSSPVTLLVRFMLYLSGELLFEQGHQNLT